MKTADEIVRDALAEARALGVEFHTGARVPMYRRIGVRQGELFLLTSEWNEDFAGASTEGQLASGAADFSSVLVDDHPTVPGVARITRIEVSDRGTSTLENGQEITIVPKRDPDSGLAPRATFRGGILAQVGAELAGVLQVEVFYSRKPRAITDADDEVELYPPHDELLAYDLALHKLKELDKETPGLERALAVLKEREAAALARFEHHVRTIAPLASRHGFR